MSVSQARLKQARAGGELLGRENCRCGRRVQSESKEEGASALITASEEQLGKQTNLLDSQTQPHSQVDLAVATEPVGL